MFGPIEIPFDSVMLFNVIKLKPETNFEDVEMAVAEMCSIVKESYSDEEGGFIAGQVMKFSGFVSDVGSISNYGDEGEHLAIVTYWKSYSHHEKSHLDAVFNEKFSELSEMCLDSKELGYEILWQGMKN